MHAEIRRARDEIQRKRAELRTLRAGDVRPPLAVALARVDELLAAQTAEAAPWLASLLGEIVSTGRSAPQRLVDSRDHRALQATITALLPGLIGDALKERVRAEYAGNSTETIHPDELPLRIATVERELLALEVRDVALSEKHGEPLRADTNPRALLGVA